MTRLHPSLLVERGSQVASFLAGSWRVSPPPLVLPNETLRDIIPHIIQTGAGALGWWKVRGQARPNLPHSDRLQELYRLHTLEAWMHEVQLEETIDILRWPGGVEPISSKGWAVARIYPEAGLRPYGDLDLHVDPSRVSDAIRTLSEFPHTCNWVDLHRGVPDLPDRSYHELHHRAERLPIRETIVRTLRDEDHLRLLCLHFVRHGGWRPLWLCDIAAFLEFRAAGFDWDYCLSGDRRLTAWVCAILGLAGRLLGARMDVVPSERVTGEPNWLDEVILEEWGKSNAGDSHTRDTKPMAAHLRSPWTLVAGVKCRIPNPIEAVFNQQGHPDKAEGVGVLQSRFCLKRAWHLAKRWASLRSLRSHTPSPVEIHVSE